MNFSTRRPEQALKTGNVDRETALSLHRQAEELNREAQEKLKSLSWISNALSRYGRILYEVEIPDDNGSNYLEWDKKPNKEVREKIQKALDDAGQKHIIGKEAEGQRIYKELSGLLGSDKAASEFLHSMGYVGIKYPAEYMSGGRSDGAKNYVIFDENDLKITDKIRFHKAEDGEYEPEMKPTFYSNAERAVEGIKQDKATPEQWLKMVEKAGGLKAGEDKWLGLSEWLKGSDKKSLTKQEVLDYIRQEQDRD